MCGIVYAQSFNGQPVNNEVLQQFDQQRNRGTEGFGLFNGKHLVHAAKEDRILNWLVKEKNESELIMFHHRRPTSTINVRKAAHPFSTKDYFGKTQYILIHNGYITNDDDLHEEHLKLGIEYQSYLDDDTFNDSEALLWDFALTMEGKQKELKVAGGIAFTCMKLVDGELSKLYFARNTNPLNMARDKTGIMLSSEGEGEAIERDVLHTWHYNSKRLTTKKMDIPTYVASKNWNYVGGYTGQHARSSDRVWAGYDIHGNYVGSMGEYDSLGNYIGSDDELMWANIKKRFGWKDETDKRYDPMWCEWCENLGYANGCEECGLYPLIDRNDKSENSVRKAEIETEAMSYLAEAEGNFEDAIWAMETDYDDLEEEGGLDDETTNKLILLQEATDFLCLNPEYIDMNSTSSVWEALCNQQKLLN